MTIKAGSCGVQTSDISAAARTIETIAPSSFRLNGHAAPLIAPRS